MKTIAHVLKNTQVQMLLITISLALIVNATASFNLTSRL